MAHRVMACTGNDHLDATDRGQRNGGDIGIVELSVVLILPNFFGGKDTLDFTPGQPADQVKVVDVEVAEDSAGARDEIFVAGSVVPLGHAHRV